MIYSIIFSTSPLLHKTNGIASINKISHEKEILALGTNSCEKATILSELLALTKWHVTFKYFNVLFPISLF